MVTFLVVRTVRVVSVTRATPNLLFTCNQVSIKHRLTKRVRFRFRLQERVTATERKKVWSENVLIEKQLMRHWQNKASSMSSTLQGQTSLSCR